MFGYLSHPVLTGGYVVSGGPHSNNRVDFQIQLTLRDPRLLEIDAPGPPDAVLPLQDGAALIVVSAEDVRLHRRPWRRQHATVG